MSVNMAFFQHVILLIINRVELVYAIHCLCSIVCLVLTMYRYIRWILNHYQPLLNARRLARWDMMRTFANEQNTSNLSVGLRQLSPIKGTQWFYKKWNFSFSANQGFRSNMEDRMSYLHEPKKHNFSMYSLFDGHGGYQVADYLEQHFNRQVFRMLNEKEQRFGDHIYKDDELIERALIDEVERIDSDIAFTRLSTSYTGSTLISAFVSHNRYLTIINVGDSRAVGADYDGNCVDLSVDHKPHHPDERERIEKAGGFVEFYGVERVQGILAVSRAFGDTELKRLVISTPGITRTDLHFRPLRYILLASDGFWDVVKSQEAILEVNYLLSKEPFETNLSSEPRDTKDSPNLVSSTKSLKTAETQKQKRPLDSPTTKTTDLGVFQAKRIGSVKSNNKPSTEQQTLKTDIADLVPKESKEESTKIREKVSNEKDYSLLSDQDKEDKNPLEERQKLDVATHLVKLALKRRSPDNISVFFIRLDKF